MAYECDNCNDTGECPECGGAGWVDDEEDGGTKSCPDCEDSNGKCIECGGKPDEEDEIDNGEDGVCDSRIDPNF